ncbi:chromate resistance protein [Curvibacter sp. CHRR-16]|uniref:chromate resistance protein ChrB domain-containing protein n=1 Tax=Curvibacter sp. CHRR-16 TaxID=2835872 RepID=UPI001BDB13AE|nr:chromate resistance protein ChrB domain-containing protein [Curvibacter sp. CHRR-16]MBT0569318.1 chromate resistance protein [Curvibacter sp. CHRR-16]
MNEWLTIITTLPTENATLRQRAWRALKASGAAVLRDGVYLMPERPDCRTTLENLAADVREGGGAAHVLRVESPDATSFVSLFDRSHEFATLLNETALIQQTLSADTAQDALRKARKLRKSFSALAEIDFFPGEAQRQTHSALSALELACARTLSPDEPEVTQGTLVRYRPSDFQGRMWATRQRPWVDRLASAWLIRRFIDPQARLLWLAKPADCPSEALSFDFDGARFTHVGSRVTFEVLMASFGLEQAGLNRLGLLVHYLDVGGVQPPEAAGIESVLAGMRESITDDDQLLAAASSIFDGLLASFDKGTQTP